MQFCTEHEEVIMFAVIPHPYAYPKQALYLDPQVSLLKRLACSCDVGQFTGVDIPCWQQVTTFGHSVDAAYQQHPVFMNDHGTGANAEWTPRSWTFIEYICL